MQYDNTNLPEDVKKYLDEIYNNEELTDAFYDCDIEIFDEATVKYLEEDASELDNLMGHGESTYKSIKPFARDGTGALWVVLDDELIGYIGSEGECGIVARNIHEFMNIASVWGGFLCDYWREETLASEDVFYLTMNDPDRLADYDDIEERKRVLNDFIEKHGFTKEIYEIAVKGITQTPFFVIKATTDEDVDSQSLISNLDGQERLEHLIKCLGQEQ